MDNALPVNRDTKLVLASSAGRMVGYGILDVVFALYLVALGFTVAQIGVLITATLLGSALLNFAIAVVADRLGRRIALAVTTLLMALSGLILVAGLGYSWQLLAAFSGTLNFTAASTSGFVAIEQAIIPQIAPASAVNRLFGRYNIVSLLARVIGALLAGAPELLAQVFGFDLVFSYRVLLVLFITLSMGSVACTLALSAHVEVREPKAEKARPVLQLRRSQKAVLKLSGLFGIDALSSGFIAQSLLVLWFFERFAVGAAVLGPLFSVARLIQAASYHVAMRLADRYGLLRTMVFTHLPSQFLLLALAAAPTLPIAIALFLLRQALSHMDVPIRQAYLTVLVTPDERTAAAGVTNLTRNLTQSISPSITGATFQAFAYSVPLVLSAATGIIYDVALYFSFRRERLAREDFVLID